MYTTLAAAFIACTAATMGQADAGTTGPAATAATAPGGLAGLQAQVSQIEGHAAALSATEQARVRHYWTAWRMEHALPLRAAGATRAAGKATGGAQRTWMRAAVTTARPKAKTKTTAKPKASAKPAAKASASAAATKAASTARPAGGWLSVPPQSAQRAPLAPALTASTAVARWNGGGAVADTTGKVFFSLGSDDYVCSGSTVASANSDVVVTAGHCVDSTGTWATNWTFVPGYDNGNAPYGSYTARQFYVSSAWSNQANNDDDVAFVTVNQDSLDGASVPVAQEVGGQGIKFGVQPKVVTVFGYPSDPPYNGQQLFYCSGATKSDPYKATTDAGMRCDMTAGSSGGPWLDGFDWSTGTGTITSVSSFKYSNNNQILYGPRLTSTAQALYQAAEHS
jgi:V8-like Glu-specific endopeptidase